MTKEQQIFESAKQSLLYGVIASFIVLVVST